MKASLPSTEFYKPDVLGEWSERKIDIVAKYAVPYAQIIRSKNLVPIYIDGLSGGGTAVRKGTNEKIATTAVRVLNAEPSFQKYFFLDLNEQKTKALKDYCDARNEDEETRRNVEVIPGDTNENLINKVIPYVQSRSKHRALCFLDPYAMVVSWGVFEAAGKTRQIETFINFPSMDIVRNILRPSLESIEQSHADRMTKLWGDESWRDVAFKKQPGLFTDEISEPESIQRVLSGFCKRLKKIAGFNFVSEGIPMQNSKNGLLYHLLFATQKEVALNIATDVLRKRANPTTLGLHG